MLCRAATWAGLGLAALMMLFGLTLAMPVETWRTGQQSSEPLPILAPSELPTAPARIWIDADPACGKGPRVDPDDCLAIRHLVRHSGISIAGVSTVFGNAPLETTDAIARELLARLAPLRDDVPVHRGAAAPMRQAGTGTDAEHALASALSEDRLTIVALGPLTNLAAALRGRPELHDNVRMIVAVMGRRPGHIFHPAEGAGGGSLFGHGPVFRDFNVAQDPDAVEVIIGLGIPLVLVPYEVARELEIDDRTLDQIAASGADGQWVAERARPWLEYWQTDIGREGFYPFDLLAALFVTDPTRFACAPVAVDLRRDGTVFFPFSRMQSLLIEPIDAGPGNEARALYCHGLLRRAAGGAEHCGRAGRRGD
ncbi:MAG: nucleoside hydrolase [Ectothiorhodospiraceae bacterium]|nr:nucleoside hydrolase [Ectothiorhodospiraceae bacterium]MCH8503279.1 nucleoside hydrolase [Ectothiorhodospiraceae bacterium]